MVRALRRVLPAESFVYLGDTARVPYGSKSPRTVERYSLNCQRFLLDRGVKAVVVACNTASATALPALAKASETPVVGAVDPGAQSALEQSAHRHIGVIGTLATIRSQAYTRAIVALSPSASVVGLPSPLLVPLAEEGWVDGEVAEAVVSRYLDELWEMDSEIDTLVLGCTHYPLLRPVISRLATARWGRSVSVVDSASAMAVATRDLLVERSLIAEAPPNTAPSELRCCVTDATRMDELATRFLGEAPSEIELVDL